MVDSTAIDVNAARVVIVGEDWCPFCTGAVNYFKQKNIDFKWIDSGENPEARNELRSKYKWSSIPGIFIDGQFTQGYSETKAKINKGEIKL